MRLKIRHLGCVSIKWWSLYKLHWPSMPRSSDGLSDLPSSGICRSIEGYLRLVKRSPVTISQYSVGAWTPGSQEIRVFGGYWTDRSKPIVWC